MCGRSGMRSARRGCTMRCPRSHRARRLRARGAACEGQQRNVAGALNGHAQPALVPRAHAGHAARKNLPALLHELRQNVRALVVDEVHLLDAELAHFLFPEVLPLAAWPPAWTASSAGSATGASLTPVAT